MPATKFPSNRTIAAHATPGVDIITGLNYWAEELRIRGLDVEAQVMGAAATEILRLRDEAALKERPLSP